MAEITVDLLGEDAWEDYRELRLAALRESPDAFVTDDEVESPSDDEEAWRARLRVRRFTASRDGEQVGVVGLGVDDEDETVGEIRDLWVAPQARRQRIARALVRAAAQQAVKDGRHTLKYWVGTDNGPAVGFASALGFFPTSERRPLPGPDGSEAIAMKIALTSDPTSVRNPLLP